MVEGQESALRVKFQTTMFTVDDLRILKNFLEIPNYIQACLLFGGTDNFANFSRKEKDLKMLKFIKGLLSARGG